jgi:hypothetical protein
VAQRFDVVERPRSADLDRLDQLEWVFDVATGSLGPAAKKARLSDVVSA